MGDLAPTKLHHRLHAIPFLQESNRVIFLKFVIVIIGVGAELQLLHLDDVLLALGFVLLLLIFVLPLPIIHRLGHGRLRGGCDQNEVKPKFLGLANGGRGGHHLHCSIGKYRADFPRANRFVHVLPDPRPAGRKSSWIHRRISPKTSEQVTMVQWYQI